jgi:hypothetical protein
MFNLNIHLAEDQVGVWPTHLECRRYLTSDDLPLWQDLQVATSDQLVSSFSEPPL